MSMSLSVSEPMYVKVDYATNSSTALVVPVTGKRVRVLGCFLVSAGTTTVTFQDDAATTITGAMSLVANSVLTLPVSGIQGYTQTAVGKGLNMALGGSVQVSGSLTYVLVG